MSKKDISTFLRIIPEKDHIRGEFTLDNDTTVSIIFHSPEHILELFYALMESAGQVWPGNEWLQLYQSGRVVETREEIRQNVKPNQSIH